MGREREPKPFKLPFEEVVQLAKELLLEGGEHPTTVLVEGSKETAGIAIEMPETHEAKLSLMYVTGVTIAASGELGELQQVYLVAEGWMSRYPKDKPPQHRPSQDPNRVEVLVISNLQLATGKTMMVTFEMVRDKAGKLVELKDRRNATSEDQHADSPLLVSFAAGFARGRGGAVQ